jgi:ABC-2 type transport system permease protein
MVHPLLYDIRKTFMSKSVLISMALLIAISLFLINSFAVTTTPQNTFANSQVLTWYDSSGTYHFLAFETNQFGQPLSGISLQGNLTISFQAFKGPPPSNLNSYPVYQGPIVITNSTGMAEFTIQVPTNQMKNVNANYTAAIRINQPNGFPNTFGYGSTPYSQFVSLSNGTGTSVPIPAGQVEGLGFNPINTVTDSKNSQISDIQVIWAGPFGSVPKGYSVYYQFYNETCTTFAQPGGSSTQCTGSGPAFPANLTESNMKFLGNLTTYDQIFKPPPLEANVSQNANIALSLFYPNGTSVTQGIQTFSTSNFYPQAQTYTQGSINQIILGFFLAIFGTFIPLIAIVVSYNTYCKDRVSGVLESVLAQPVSRRGLSISRFIASFVAMAIAVSIAMGVVDAITSYFTKSFVNSTIMLSSAGAFFAELAAFTGIMMLLSRVIKSSGILIGIGIGLFIVIDFFWGVILSLIASANGTFINSLGYYSLAIGSEFFNPAQFVGLVDTYLTHQVNMAGIGAGFGFGFEITPSQYGITIPSLIATGILWGIIPLAGFLYLAIKRD